MTITQWCAQLFGLALAGAFGLAAGHAAPAAAHDLHAVATFIQDEEGGSGDDEPEDEDEEEDEEKSIDEMTEDHEVIDGLFKLYRDPDTGSLQMEIRADQLDKDYVYATFTDNGVVWAGHFTGAYRANAIFRIKKEFNKLYIVAENTFFEFDDDNAIARAAEANISPAVLAAEKIVAKDDDAGRYLIKADGLFLSEALHRVKPINFPGSDSEFSFSVGSLAKDKTRYAEVRNYPENTDIVVEYVYSNPGAFVRGGLDVTDPRAVSIRVQHTLHELPEEGYTPRQDDFRVGYFFDRKTDLTSMDPTPYADLINRWRLEKQDPEAEISDPVKPITWWIENTTPEQYRDTIRDAALAWNLAFEKAGFSNAVEVRVQPDDADWDAGDIRYNVLRWTSSPNPPFGGYGPSFSNPRTGEIMGADIMLEFSFITNRLNNGIAFDVAGLLSAPQDFEEMAEAAHKGHNHGGPLDKQFCTVGHELRTQLMFGLAALQAAGASEEDRERLVEESIYYLILHEIGHTLGLNHNMKASQLHPVPEVYDASITEPAGLAGSVMDYPAINFAPEGYGPSQFYSTKPGPYDDWAIIFGYAPEIDDPAAREALLARSLEPELAFGNDADDMRAPGRGLDPRVMIGDMSAEAIDYGTDRIELVKSLLGGLADRYSEPGEQSWHAMRDAFLILTGQHGAQAGVMARYIGGVYVERATPDQEGATQPFTPVPEALQRKAMDQLAEHLFSPDSFEISEEVAARLQLQRRGFDFFGTEEEPILHARIVNIQNNVLNQLLHPRVLERITDSEVYGNTYSVDEMVGDLTDAIFAGDTLRTDSSIQQNLQVAYVSRLAAVANLPFFDFQARTAALASLKDIQRKLGMPLLDFSKDASVRAHHDYLRRIIRRATF